MRLFGNAIQNYYGTLAISTPGGGSFSINTAGNVTAGAPSGGYTLAISNGNGASSCVSISGASSTNASMEFAGNGNVVGTTSLLVGQGSDSQAYLYQRANANLNLATNSITRLIIAPSGNVTINAPSSGSSLTINSVSAPTNSAVSIIGQSPTNALPDLLITRAGSTANSQSLGPTIQLLDSSNVTAASIQNSGGQLEFWQYEGGWAQSAFFDTSRNLNINNGAGSRSPVYAGIPQNSLSGNYTTVLADANKHLLMNQGSAVTINIAANSSVAYPVGTAITFVNLGTVALSIGINSDTIYLAASGATGTRSLAPKSVATALKVGSTVWMISGSGLS